MYSMAQLHAYIANRVTRPIEFWQNMRRLSASVVVTGGLFLSRVMVAIANSHAVRTSDSFLRSKRRPGVRARARRAAVF